MEILLTIQTIARPRGGLYESPHSYQISGVYPKNPYRFIRSFKVCSKKWKGRADIQFASSDQWNALNALASLQKGWTVEADYKISSDLQFAD